MRQAIQICIMPRKPLFRTNVFPYHITARCNNREDFYCDEMESWNILTCHLHEICIIFGVKIHAFVMMNNHFHLLFSTPNESIDKVMHRFMLSTTKSLNRSSGRSGKVFGGRYHWSLIDSTHYYDQVTKYIYRNPVRAALVSRVEDYNYSSLKSVLGEVKPPFMLSPIMGNDSLVPVLRSEDFLEWLNIPFYNEQELAIKKGLRKTQFAPSNRPNEINTGFKGFDAS